MFNFHLIYNDTDYETWIIQTDIPSVLCHHKMDNRILSISIKMINGNIRAILGFWAEHRKLLAQRHQACSVKTTKMLLQNSHRSLPSAHP